MHCIKTQLSFTLKQKLFLKSYYFLQTYDSHIFIQNFVAHQIFEIYSLLCMDIFHPIWRPDTLFWNIFWLLRILEKYQWYSLQLNPHEQTKPKCVLIIVYRIKPQGSTSPQKCIHWFFGIFDLELSLFGFNCIFLCHWIKNETRTFTDNYNFVFEAYSCFKCLVAWNMMH